MEGAGEREKPSKEIGRKFWCKKEYRCEFSGLVAVGWYLRTARICQGKQVLVLEVLI